MFSSPTEFLHHVATKRGKILRGGIPDTESAARVVLHDWNSGKIPYYTIPPESDFAQNRLEASIVTEWSAAFKLSDIMELEQTSVLKELSENQNLETFATPIASEPLHPHSAFMKLNRGDDDMLEDIEEDKPKKKLAKKSKGEIALAPFREKSEAPAKKSKKSQELVLNPSLNTELKKDYKEDKKAEKKTEKFQIKQGIIINLEEKVQDSYDFGTDFWNTPSLEATEKKNEEDEDEELKDVNAFAF